MANSILGPSPGLIEVTSHGSRSREFVDAYQLARGSFDMDRMISDCQFYDMQHRADDPMGRVYDGDHFIKRAEREARKSTLRFALLVTAIVVPLLLWRLFA